MLLIWVVQFSKLGSLLGSVFIRVPHKIGDLRRDPNFGELTWPKSRLDMLEDRPRLS